MLLARKFLLAFAILTPISACGTDLIRESFDSKTPGTSLPGQSVEFALEPSSWFDFSEAGAATSQWMVSNATAFGGPNSVQADSSGTGSSNVATFASGTYPPFDPLHPTYRLTGALNVASGGSNVGYGIGLVSDKFLGALYILNTGEVVVLGGPGGGKAAYSAPGVPLVVGLDTWHSLEARFHFSDEHNATASFFMDGTALSFDGVSSGSFSLTTSKQPRSLFMESASADGTSPMSGHAHFDSLNLKAVPEPTSAVALGIGLVALARKRRR